MKQQDITAMKTEELTAKLGELRDELRRDRFAGAGAQVANPGKYRENRRSVARILTELTAREISQEDDQ